MSKTYDVVLHVEDDVVGPTPRPTSSTSRTTSTMRTISRTRSSMPRTSIVLDFEDVVLEVY